MVQFAESFGLQIYFCLYVSGLGNRKKRAVLFKGVQKLTYMKFLIISVILYDLFCKILMSFCLADKFFTECTGSLLAVAAYFKELNLTVSRLA